MHISTLLIFVLSVTTSLAAPVARKGRFCHLVTLGDSLSDNGNTFRLTNGADPAPPTYPSQRYSNGPVWAEYFAQSTGMQLLDRAFGGATSDSVKVPGQAPFGTVVSAMPGIIQQANEFVKNRAGANPANAIVSLWIGGNDYFQAAAFKRADITPQFVVSNIMTAINTLNKAGFKNLLVFNLPPGNPAVPADAHNRELASKLAAFTAKNRDVNITPIDMNAALVTIVGKLTALGQAPKVLDASQGCVSQVKPGVVCPNPDDFVTWDGIHPTTKIHKEISEFVKGVMSTKALLT